MKINFNEYFFFLHRKTLKPKGSIFIFLVLLKLSEENEMSEVLGSFSADHAALYTAYRKIIPNELSFFFHKGGLSIYFLISTSCFPGGVPATKYKNHFLICSSSRQHQPRMLDNAGSVSLVFNYSTPRCVLMAHVSSAVFCDSNVETQEIPFRNSRPCPDTGCNWPNPDTKTGTIFKKLPGRSEVRQRPASQPGCCHATPSLRENWFQWKTKAHHLFKF